MDGDEEIIQNGVFIGNNSSGHNNDKSRKDNGCKIDRDKRESERRKLKRKQYQEAPSSLCAMPSQVLLVDIIPSLHANSADDTSQHAFYTPWHCTR